MFDMLTSPYTHPLKKLIWMRLKAGARAVYDTISGNPVSFTSLAAPLRKLQIAFSPVQDLHGYDSPWPAGGGANKWNEEWEIGGIASADGQDVPQSVTIRCIGYIPVIGGETYYVINPSGKSAYLFFYDANKAYIGNSGGYVTAAQTVPSGASFMRFQMSSAYGTTYNHDIAINYPATVMSYRPYSNECPISGWSSLGVEQRGVNMWDEEWENARINLTTGAVASGNGLLSKNLIPVVPNTQYHAVSGSYTGGTSFLLAYYDADGSYLNYEVKFGMSVNFTTPANARFIRFNIQTSEAVTYNHDASINYPATETAYVPYNPSSRSISISLGSTYYSGWVDAVTGIGEVTWAANDMGTLSWFLQSAGIFRGSAVRAYGVGKFNIISSMYNTYTGGHSTGANIGQLVAENGDGVYINSGSATFFVADARFDNLEDFVTAVTGQTLCYELATPIPIQLTPQEVSSLLGENNVWSDTNGDLTVEYRSN